MSASLELQGAVVGLIRASATLQGLIANPVRLYQDVIPAPTFPYITIGETQDLPDLAECIDGWEIYLTLHVWSRRGGFAESRRIGAALDDALHNQAPALEGYRCLLMERHSTHYLTDPDNNTRHGVVVFRALIEPADTGLFKLDVSELDGADVLG